MLVMIVAGRGAHEVKEVMARRGWDVASVETAADLAAAVRANRPDVIVIDGTRENVRAWAALRGDPEAGHIPVLVRARGIGANAWFLTAGSHGEVLAWVDERATADGLFAGILRTAQRGARPWGMRPILAVWGAAIGAFAAAAGVSLIFFVRGGAHPLVRFGNVFGLAGVLCFFLPIATRARMNGERVPLYTSAVIALVLVAVGLSLFRWAVFGRGA